MERIETNMLFMRNFVIALAVLAFVPVAAFSAPSETANPAAWRPRERWRGFNLPGKAIKGSFSGKWFEDDLRMMHEFGFNFARVPLDYRYWCQDDNPMSPDPKKFASIDEMLAWGKKYKIHIQLCFTTAPGMDLKTRSKKALFTNAAAQDAFAAYWAYIARRYRNIPNDALSFNLLNEPSADASEENYLVFIKKLVSAIHVEDPKRFVVVDGLHWAHNPHLASIGLPVGQSHHAYLPASVSNWQAAWIRESMIRDVPVWPPSPATSPIFGSRKPERQSPVVIENVPKGTLSICTGLFSRAAELIVEADGRILFSRFFQPSPNEPGWSNIVVRSDGAKKEWAGNLTEKTIRVEVPRCKRLSLRLGRGDWLDISSLEFSAEGKKAVLPFFAEWDHSRRHDMRFAGFGVKQPFVSADGTAYTGNTYLKEKTWDLWKPVLEAGQFVMVGEVGCYNKTPHGVALLWLEDNLRIFKEKGIGWAMWNFRGSMGIMDSGRTDVKYENYKGHKLDRKMLELLQRY